MIYAITYPDKPGVTLTRDLERDTDGKFIRQPYDGCGFIDVESFVYRTIERDLGYMFSHKESFSKADLIRICTQVVEQVVYDLSWGMKINEINRRRKSANAYLTLLKECRILKNKSSR